MAAKKKAAKKKAGKAKGARGAKPTKGPGPAKPPRAESNSGGATAPKQFTADQRVLALSNVLSGALSGQSAQIAMTALAATVARVCLGTKTNSVNFGPLLTAQVEIQARLMIGEAQSAASKGGEGK